MIALLAAYFHRAFAIPIALQSAMSPLISSSSAPVKGVSRPHFPYFSCLLLLITGVLFIAMIAWGGGIAPAADNPMLGPFPRAMIQFGAKFAPIQVRRNYQSCSTHNMSHRASPHTTLISVRLAKPLIHSATALRSAAVLFTVESRPALAAVREHWRPFVSTFLYAGFIHILLGWTLGMPVLFYLERLYGTPRTWFVWLVAGWAGQLWSALFGPTLIGVGGTTAMAGMIGVYWAHLMLTHELHSKRELYSGLLYTGVMYLVLLVFGIFPYVNNW